MMYRLSSRVVLQTLDDSSVLLDLEQGQYYELNAVAASAVEVLDQCNSVSDFVSRLLPHYEVEIDRLETDIRNLLDELASTGLLERVA